MSSCALETTLKSYKLLPQAWSVQWYEGIVGFCVMIICKDWYDAGGSVYEEGSWWCKWCHYQPSLYLCKSPALLISSRLTAHIQDDLARQGQRVKDEKYRFVIIILTLLAWSAVWSSVCCCINHIVSSPSLSQWPQICLSCWRMLTESPAKYLTNANDNKTTRSHEDDRLQGQREDRIKKIEVVVGLLRISPHDGCVLTKGSSELIK